MTKRVSIRVVGKVQGVFFRASTKEKADQLGVNGTVCNEQDGSVFIEAQADEQKLNQFIQWCRQGPAAAHVEQLIISDSMAPLQSGFKILR